MSDSSKPRGAHAPGVGLLAGLGAFVLWGVLPLYWLQLPNAPADQIVAHRVVWSLGFVAWLLARARRWGELRALRRGKALAATALAGLALGANWLIFIWAVDVGRVVDTSLGYFLTPLVNLLVGLVVFRERLAGWQWLAVALAAAGVGQLAWSMSALPWLSLALCGTWALYGALRKVSALDSIPGLLAETAVLAPLALAWLWREHAAGRGAFGPDDPVEMALLVAAGAATALPILLFSVAARSLRYTTVSFLQYIAPSIGLLLGLFVWNEQVSLAKWLAFAAIWAGLAVFSFDAWRKGRGKGIGG